MPADLLSVDTFYILDFDRCLAHTEKFQPILEEVIRQTTTITSEEIYEARRASIGSFDTASYVRRRLVETGQGSERVWNDIEAAFIQKGESEDLLEPNARELLAVLDQNAVRYGIVTFGGEIWQRAKIAAAGLSHIPYLITDKKEKGVQIATWHDAHRGGYLLPEALSSVPVLAQSLVFIDDNPISFTGLPSDVRGVCVVPIENEVQMSPVEGLSTNVTVVHGLSEVIDLLFR